MTTLLRLAAAPVTAVAGYFQPRPAGDCRVYHHACPRCGQRWCFGAAGRAAG